MKLLFDMGISHRVTAACRRRGHDAVHLRELSLERLPDPLILEKAAADGAVLITHDLDFPDLLAASRARLPSVVLLRLRNMSSTNVEHFLVPVLVRYEDQLLQGAVATLREDRLRLRFLPIDD